MKLSKESNTKRRMRFLEDKVIICVLDKRELLEDYEPILVHVKDSYLASEESWNEINHIIIGIFLKGHILMEAGASLVYQGDKPVMFEGKKSSL